MGYIRQISESITVNRLWGEPDEPRLLVVDFGRHAQWPGEDHHHGQELVYVTRGVYIDAGQHYEAGAFIRYPAGSSHSPSAGPDGCQLIVMYPDG